MFMLVPTLFSYIMIIRQYIRILYFIMVQCSIVSSYKSLDVLIKDKRPSQIVHDEIHPSEIIKFDEMNTYRIQESEKKRTEVYFVDSFLEIQRDARWPLPFSTSSSIIATFGQVNDNKINRGIDISGFEEDPVNAVYNGIVHRIRPGEVIIEHRFKHWTRLHENKPSTKSWYTFYSNVDTDMKVGDKVHAGQEIGELTSLSSSHDQPHLHFELRVGSTCSHVEGLQNDCISTGYDPHVHPLLLIETVDGPEFDRPKMHVVADIGPFSDGIIEISTPQSQPNLNRFELEIIGKDKKSKKNHVLDLNLRTGFNHLNTMNKLNPHLLSVQSQLDDIIDNELPLWKTQLILPADWVEHKDRYDWFRLVVEDIWGKKTYFSFTSEQMSW